MFKEILIDKELRKLHGKDHQLIHLFLNVQLDMEALINKKRAKALQNEDVGKTAFTPSCHSLMLRQFLLYTPYW